MKMAEDFENNVIAQCPNYKKCNLFIFYVDREKINQMYPHSPSSLYMQMEQN